MSLETMKNYIDEITKRVKHLQSVARLGISDHSTDPQVETAKDDISPVVFDESYDFTSRFQS